MGLAVSDLYVARGALLDLGGLGALFIGSTLLFFYFLILYNQAFEAFSIIADRGSRRRYRVVEANPDFLIMILYLGFGMSATPEEGIPAHIT